MKSSHTLGIAFLILAAGALADPPPDAPQPQKYRLGDVTEVGDVSVSDSLEEMALTVHVSAEGQEAPAIKFQQRERERYTETILAVDKDGSATVVRRRYEISRSFETTPDGKSAQKTSSLQGKTVVIRAAGGKVTVTPQTGKLAPADVKSIQGESHWKNTDSPSFFPDREIGPGDEWELDPKAVAGALPGLEKGEVKGKFLEVTQRDGRACARIGLEITMEGKPTGAPVPVKVKATGSGLYDLGLNRTLSLDLSGPMTMNGEAEQMGLKLRFDGEGQMKTHETQTWLKVGGKPVTAVKG